MKKSSKKIVKKFMQPIKMAGKKDMPVSELAGMVARGFTDMKDDLRDVEERLTGRIDAVEGRLTVVEQKVDRFQNSVSEFAYDSRKVRSRIENLELKAFGSIQEA